MNDDEILLDCPYCGAETAVDLASIDPDEDGVIIDCAVCCRPLRLCGLGGEPDDLRLEYEG